MTVGVGPTMDLAGLVAATRTLYERVDDPVAVVTDPGQPVEAEAQLARWKAMFADIGPDAFARRLGLDGWTEATIAPYLNRTRRPVGAELPRWAVLLEGCVDAMLASACHDPRDDVLGGHQPRLFEQVFSPAVRQASTELRRRSPNTRRLLSPTALADAETSLLDALVQVSTPTLTLEFQAFRSAREPTLFRMLRRVKDERSSELYREFLRRLRTDGVVDLLTTYPVLGRCWGLVVQTWLDTLTEMLDRLERDRAVLNARLGVSLDVSGLHHLTMALSDGHHGGRSVMMLDFGGGAQVLYKPKSLALEEAFGRLLGWLNWQGAPVTLRVIEVVDRGAYGWVEFVDAADCEGREDVVAYYRRAGGLLCLVHLLDGTDCHLENIIAAGGDPVLVDAEALLHHRVAAGHAGDGSGQIADDVRAVERHRRSVLRTGMLPGWTLDGGGNPIDTSGLGGFGAQATERQVMHWEHVNSDELRLRQRLGRLPRAHNVPTLDGVPQSLLDFRTELVSGFTLMYRFCQQHVTALTDPDGPLHALAPGASRFIARDSATYGRIRNGLLEPLALTSGIAQTLRLEALAVGHLSGSGAADRWPLVRAEMAALQQLDIPYFSAAVTSSDLDLPTGTRLPGFFDDASFAAVLSKINGSSRADLRDQVRYIEATLYTRAVENTHDPGVMRRGTVRRLSASVVDELDADGLDGDELGADELDGELDADGYVAEAVRLAGQIADDAVRPDGGGASWLGLDYDAATRRYRYQPLGYGLYSGRCGIGIFLAALWSVTGDARWRELAGAVVAGLRDAVHSEPENPPWPVSGATMAYALGRMGQLLRDPELVDDAVLAASRIPERLIEDDDTFDVLSGCAGGLLSFLFLHRCGGSEEMLSKAVACGERLVEGRVATTTGHRAWARRGSVALTGYSHGAAGGAYALHQLFKATGGSGYRDAAREAIAFERAVFDSDAGNWPDFRSGDPGVAAPVFMAAWCHGAAGIGLSRLGMRGSARDGSVADEVEAALVATRRARSSTLDQVCCGNFGRIELLLTAGIELDRPELVAQANRWAAARVREARRRQGYGVLARLPRGVRSDGFYQGVAGIGYELLRLARPTELPVVLRCE